MKKSKQDIAQIVQEVKQDYFQRREKRRNYELQWQLNINFVMGNQYSFISPLGKILEDDKRFFWQEKEVFNHIAPTIETRISRISRMKPNMNVIPASTDESDVQSAKLSKEILRAISSKIELGYLVKNALTWSEICGTVFYKVVWNTELGNIVAFDETGKALKEGDVDVIVCSPFEIFPDNLSCENINDCKSIIHAKAYDIDEIKMVWGVDVTKENVKSFTLDSGYGNVGGLGYDASISKVSNIDLDNHCILLEKYTKPNTLYPNGRLIIVAGDELLFDGELPYKNDDMNSRTFPFIKQVSNFMPGNFFGTSVIERMIPIQRAYNAVRNRKHEYFNRASLGVLTVEDGSVDTDNLELEGLSPGKVLVYRQGGKAPEIMEIPDTKIDFDTEEDKLLDEFKIVSGVSDLMSESYSNYTNMSGVALQLLAEQDDTRLGNSLDSLKASVCLLAKNILRLYKQFAVLPRLLKIAGEGGDVELYYWDNSEIKSDDIVFDTSTDLGETLGQRRTMLLDLIKAGLLYDNEGKFSQSMRKKCLDLLGFGLWEHTLDINSLQINRAQEENLEVVQNKSVEILSIDEHQIHIDEHVAFLLSKDFKTLKNKNTVQEKLLLHIDLHKQMLKQQIENENNFEKKLSDK